MDATKEPLYTFGCATRDDKMVRATIGALRMYHSHLLDRSEFVVIDSSKVVHIDGVEQPSKYSEELRKLCKGIPGVNYFRASGPPSSSLYRNMVFEKARGTYVWCFDPHVMFATGAIDACIRYYDANPDTKDLLTAVLISVSGKVTATNQRLYDSEPGVLPSDAKVYNGVVCRGNQLATWNTDSRGLDPAGEPFEIQHQGMFAFSCRRDAWLGFDPSFVGFGGCETYLMEKVRENGGRVMCVPGYRGDHSFFEPEPRTFTPMLVDRVRNYLVGFKRLKTPNAEALYEATIQHYTRQNPKEVERAKAAADAILSGQPVKAVKESKPSKPADKPKAEPKPNPAYQALLNRAGLQSSETVCEALFAQLQRTPNATPILEFGSGVSTLALDANGCKVVTVERDAAKLDNLRPLLLHAETTTLIHDPDGTWRPQFGQLFDGVLIHAAEHAPPALGTMLNPGGTIVVSDTQHDAHKKLVGATVKEIGLTAYKYGDAAGKTRFFHVLKAPEQPLGEGPGTEMKDAMHREGFPACQQCITLARKMNKWGVDGCRQNMDHIVDDILPRARHWLKGKHKWVQSFLGLLHAEDATLRAAIRKKVNEAIMSYESKLATVGVVVQAMSQATIENDHIPPSEVAASRESSRK